MKGSGLRCAVVAAAVAAVVAPVQGGSIRDDRSDADYLALGIHPKYASVGSITWGFLDLSRGSGTVISPRWVLTAAHVVDTAEQRKFWAGGTTSHNGTTFSGAQRLPHENWVSPNVFDGFDIGLLRLTDPVTSIAPASRFTGSDEVGRVGTSVGFGVFATGTTPADPLALLSPSEKRAGTNMIDVLGSAAYPTEGASDNIVAADFDDPGNADGDNSFGSTDPLALEYCVTPGDSGGGIFVEVGARSFIAAVHSFLDDPFSEPPVEGQPDPNDDSLYHDTFGSTRVSVFNAWIDDKICRNWNNAAGGAFSSGGNWAGGLPDQYDVAGFNTPGTYTVALGGGPVNHRLIARAGNVTLDLSGSTYTLTSLSYEGSLIVGRYGGNDASLTIINGVFTTREAVLGEQPGSSGTIMIGAGGAWNVVGDVYAGGNCIAAGGSGSITLDPGGSTTITGALTVYGGGSVHFAGGSFSAGSIHLAGGTLDVLVPTTLAMPVVTSTGATITKAGSSSLTITGVQTHAANTTLHVLAGTLNLDSNAGDATSANLAIDADAAVNFGAAQNLRALDVAAGVVVKLSPGGEKFIRTADLSVAGKLDLADNKLIVDAGELGSWNGSSYTGVASLIDSGRGDAGNAQWDGNGLVTSDTRAIDTADLASLAVATAAQLGRTTFAGQSVSADDVLVMLTWGGDANLDGRINIDDYGRIDGNVAQSGSVFGWFNGDFNYDGKINIDDYGIIDGNVNAQGTPFSTAGEPLADLAAVPEPAGGVVLALAAPWILKRRCRRRCGSPLNRGIHA